MQGSAAVAWNSDFILNVITSHLCIFKQESGTWTGYFYNEFSVCQMENGQKQAAEQKQDDQ